MTAEKKNRIIKLVIALLEEFAEEENCAEHNKNSSLPAGEVEMLTVKECTEQIQGLTAYAVRQLAQSGKVVSVRAGDAERGKILINKNSLIEYLNMKSKI